MEWVGLSHGMRGTFAVLMTDVDGFPEPVSTGIFSERKEAIFEAKDWAYVEGIEYTGPEE